MPLNYPAIARHALANQPHNPRDCHAPFRCSRNYTRGFSIMLHDPKGAHCMFRTARKLL